VIRQKPIFSWTSLGKSGEKTRSKKANRMKKKRQSTPICANCKGGLKKKKRLKRKKNQETALAETVGQKKGERESVTCEADGDSRWEKGKIVKGSF